MSTYGTSYTAAEMQQLRDLYPSASVATILAALPGRTWISVRGQAEAMSLPRPRTVWDKWRGYPLEMVRKHYPTKGAHYVAALLGEGYSVMAVRGAARRQGIVPLKAGVHTKNKARPTPAPPLPRPAKAPKLEATKKALPAPGVSQRGSGTPNLALQKKEAARKAAPRLVPVTAVELAKLPYTHPARMAYLLAAKDGGEAAQRAYQQAMQQLKQAA